MGKNEKKIKYYKNEFLKSEAYKNKKDFINSFLEDDKLYSKKDVDRMIKTYLEGVI